MTHGNASPATRADIERVESAQALHITRNDEQHEEMQLVLRRSTTVLFGNGKIGLDERVRNLESLATSILSWGKWIKFGVAGVLSKALWDIIQSGNVPD